jgi:hypothetical protein
MKKNFVCIAAAALGPVISSPINSDSETLFLFYDGDNN